MFRVAKNIISQKNQMSEEEDYTVMKREEGAKITMKDIDQYLN